MTSRSTVALITGGSAGLGLALTRALSQRGWTLVVDARRADRLRAAVADLPNVHAVPGDVTDPEHLRELAATVDRLGRLDLVICNASTLGVSPLPRLADYPLDEFLSVLRVNVTGPLAVIQTMLPRLSPGAALVTVTSDAAVEAYPTWGGYGASKAALEQLTSVFAAEHPELSVYCFDPGDMRTEMHQAAYPGEDISDRPDPDEVAVPALLRLVDDRPASGRYRAADLVVPA